MTLKDIIRQLAHTGDEIYAKICEVISVNSTEMTADLQPLDGSSPIVEALLQVADKGVFVEPKAGSLVACVFITKELAVVVNHSEIEQYQLKIEPTELKIDKNGFLLKKENETLGGLVGELIKEIRQMKFTTNTGSTITLINDPKFVALEKRFNKLLKNN